MRKLLAAAAFFGILIPESRCETANSSAGLEQRQETIRELCRIADPVLVNLAAGHLKEKLPQWAPERRLYAPLEALGRLLSGMAPWLELGADSTEEGKIRAKYIALAREGIRRAVDPGSSEHMEFSNKGQPVVDTAFLALALLRAPHQLWDGLDADTKANLVIAFKQTRGTRIPESNWYCFPAIIETALWKFTGECDQSAIEKAVTKHKEWYLGDGTYGDGPKNHWDYYNSYVIQPMLLQILQTCVEKGSPLGSEYPLFLKRARRYGAVQERMISPEGTYPVIGRSSVYRFAAFQTLSLLALLHELPEGLEPGGVRSALTTVITKSLSATGTFDDQGWLRPGVAGYQPSLCESYISPGSLYICSDGMLQLGLPPDDPFWTLPDHPWTQKRIWSGSDLPADHAE